MSYKIVVCFLFFIFSCKNESNTQLIDYQKESNKKKIEIFTIKKAWISSLIFIKINSTTANSWNEWNFFLNEVKQKPMFSIDSFQKKTTEILKKANQLNNSIPTEYNKPQIKSRISTLITKIKLLDLFIHLNPIPITKVTSLLPEINFEIASVENQINKIIQKNKIPLEDGELDLIKMLDSTRAISN